MNDGIGLGSIPAWLRDALRGGAESAVTSTLGAPVDLATMAMRPLGYDVEKPVMGSEWLRDRMQGAGVYPERTGSPGEAVGEFAGAMLAPGPDPLQYAAMGLGVPAMMGAIKGFGDAPAAATMQGMSDEAPKLDITGAVESLKALADELGVAINIGGSRLSESKYLTIPVRPGTKGVPMGGLQIRVSDHGTTSGTGENLMSVRVDKGDADKRLEIARRLIHYAADPSHPEAMSPMQARTRFQRTLQQKGGKRVPNPYFLSDD